MQEPHRSHHPLRRLRVAVPLAIISLLAAAVAVPALVESGVAADSHDGPPVPGLHAYTKGHAGDQDPPDRIGGPLTVTASQTQGSTRLVLPGPRFLDPSVFGTPEKPVGFDPAPFPLLGVPTDMRNTADGKYTFADHATPFSDWREVGVGDVSMTVVDQTAIDGARTKDRVDFEANFALPDGAEFRVTADEPLAHGLAYPFFGGVVTNHLLHGVTGIGSRLMPTEYTYAAFWAKGDIYRNGELINEDHLVHVMVTEIVRGENYSLNFDGEVGNPSQGITMHLMIPPFKPGAEGLQPSPLRTQFMPFPFIEKHMKQTMGRVQEMPDGPKKQKKMAVLKEVREMMMHTKEHVMEATQAGKMAGMPFIHIMFGNIEMEASR